MIDLLIRINLAIVIAMVVTIFLGLATIKFDAVNDFLVELMAVLAVLFCISMASLGLVLIYHIVWK